MISPVPFLAALALTQTQLDILANRFIGRETIDNQYVGDSSYAINSRWRYLKTPNSILPIVDTDDNEDPHCYLYILQVLLSQDGLPPKVYLPKERLLRMWKELGERPEWRCVKFVVRRWPQDPGLPGMCFIHVLSIYADS